jgi:hypothetical protein
MAPRDYSEINRITEGLYQFVSHGKIGIIKPDGTMVVDAVCTEVTPFYENLALLISKENNQDRVLGTLSISGDYCLFSKTYFTLSGQAFYSDGLLSVENENGEKGYIDENGNEMIGFQSRYTTIKPFSEGYAAVFQNKEYSLIDKSGVRQSMIIGIGKVRSGTNVYNGEAVIWDMEGKFYRFEPNSGKCRKTHKPKSAQIDYLYCFSELSKRDRTIPYSQVPSGTVKITPTQNKGKYGYSLGNKTILTPQFDRASSVEDGYAVVSANGKTGILKYIEYSDGFSVSVPPSDIAYSPGQDVECTFSVLSPAVYKDQVIDVSVKESMTSTPLSLALKDNYYSFTCHPKDSQQSYIVEISSEGMILESGTISYHFKKKSQELQISISNRNVADANGDVWVTAVVRNPNDVEVETTVTMTGGPAKFKECSKQVTIAANSSVTIRSCFYQVKTEYTNQFVRVNASNGISVTKNKMTLKPYMPDIPDIPDFF